MPPRREDNCTLADREITPRGGSGPILTLRWRKTYRLPNLTSCKLESDGVIERQREAPPLASLRSPFPHSNSRRARFRLTFQFQMLLHLGALNGALVITCVRSGRRP